MPAQIVKFVSNNDLTWCRKTHLYFRTKGGGGVMRGLVLLGFQGTNNSKEQQIMYSYQFFFHPAPGIFLSFHYPTPTALPSSSPPTPPN